MPLIAPCFCAGSLKYVHQDCLQRWIKSSDIRRCELCKYTFTMESKVREMREMGIKSRRGRHCVFVHLLRYVVIFLPFSYGKQS